MLSGRSAMLQPPPNGFPDTLCHYTIIEKFARILSNKTIRFNRLDKVEDLDEAVFVDDENANKLVFASCWSSDFQENIPLCKIYTGLKGVRIQIPTVMFPNEKCEFDNSDDSDNKIRLRLSREQQRSMVIERDMQTLKPIIVQLDEKGREIYEQIKKLLSLIILFSSHQEYVTKMIMTLALQDFLMKKLPNIVLKTLGLISVRFGHLKRSRDFESWQYVRIWLKR